MMHKLLLPNKFKTIGWFIFIPAAIVGAILLFSGLEGYPLNAKVFAILNSEIFGKEQFFTFINTDITNTLVGILFIAGALLVGFSKEKSEDEFIANIRQSSLLLAVLINYILLIFSFAFIYGTAFINVMIFNMFTTLLIFIVRFNYILYRNSKSLALEK